MFQSDSTHNPESDRDEAPPSRRRRRLARILEYVVAATFIVILVYVVMFAVKVADGVSRSVGVPSQTVRLQILNGCGLRWLSTEVSGKLDGYTDAAMEIRVVDTGDFDVRTVKKSFVIARTEDQSPAKALAKQLGLDPKEVIFLPLGHNLQNVSATLVVGQDYPIIRTLTRLSKEK
jgi:hypothetical protein